MDIYIDELSNTCSNRYNRLVCEGMKSLLNIQEHLIRNVKETETEKGKFSPWSFQVTPRLPCGIVKCLQVLSIDLICSTFEFTWSVCLFMELSLHKNHSHKLWSAELYYNLV